VYSEANQEEQNYGAEQEAEYEQEQGNQ